MAAADIYRSRDTLRRLTAECPWPVSIPAATKIKVQLSPQYRRAVEVVAAMKPSTMVALAGERVGDVITHWCDAAPAAKCIGVVAGDLERLQNAQHYTWHYRTCLTLVHRPIASGIAKLATIGVAADVLHLTPSDRFEEVTTDLTAALQLLLPSTLITGDGWEHPEIRRAVEVVVERCGFVCEVVEDCLWVINREPVWPVKRRRRANPL